MPEVQHRGWLLLVSMPFPIRELLHMTVLKGSKSTNSTPTTFRPNILESQAGAP